MTPCLLLLLAAGPTSGPELRVVAPRPAEAIARSAPLLEWLGGVLPDLRPRRITARLAPLKVDPFLPATWPPGSEGRPLSLRIDEPLLRDLLTESKGAEDEAARIERALARVRTEGMRAPKGVEGAEQADWLLEGRGLGPLGKLGGVVTLPATGASADLILEPDGVGSAWAKDVIGREPSRALIRVEASIVAELSATLRPAALLEALAVDARHAPRLKGPLQLLLTADGELIAAAEARSATAEQKRAFEQALRKVLADAEIENRDELWIVRWPGARPAGPAAVTRLTDAERRAPFYFSVTSRGLLASLEQRASARGGPKVEDGQLALVRFAYGPTLERLQSLQVEGMRAGRVFRCKIAMTLAGK